MSEESAGERPRGPLIVGLLVVLLLAVLVFLISRQGRKPPPFVPEPGPGAYQGLGTWIDIFEKDVWADPAAAVQRIAAHGVKTIYVETSNYSHEPGVIYPEETATLIDAAHSAGLKVVAWYLPGLTDVNEDLRRSLEAIRFNTDAGEGFDSFALDIESLEVRDPTERTDALMRFSRQLRDSVGVDYPLGAITPNPMRLSSEPGYWPGFPYSALSKVFDVFLPMDYFGAVAEASNRSGALHYTLGGIHLIRAGANRPEIPIHVIGGLAEDITGPELDGFLKAVDRGKAVGFSLYNFTTTGDADWAGLQAAVAAGLTEDVAASP